MFTYACGPSQEEIKQREQFVKDSTEAELARKQAVADSIAAAKEEQRIHNEKIEVGKSIKRTRLTNVLDELKKDLSKEKQRLDDIYDFQIGRSVSTKQRQLREQRDEIRELEGFITRLEKEISYTHLHESYDFQNTPLGTVEHLISAARTSDYSKLRNLIDPYGEFEQNVIKISLIEVLSEEMKQEWNSQFLNARIMGSPKIKDNTAQIEVAVGPESDRLETFNLIQRQNKWYILSF